MAKKRKGTPEHEVEEAAKRMRKHKESLRSARASRDWKQFLIEVLEVDPAAVSSPKGRDFWEKVREKVVETKIGFTPKGLAEQGVYMDTYQTKTGKTVAVLRDYETGRFVLPKKLEKR